MGNQNPGFSMEDVMQLVKSPAGQQLVKLLQNSNDPALQKARKLSAEGNMNGAKEALQHLAANEEIQKIITILEIQLMT